MLLIESLQNKFIKKIMSLKAKKGRETQNLFFIEGEKFVAEIPPGWPVYKYIMTEAYFREKTLPTGCCEEAICLVTENLFAALTDTITPQGIMAVCYKKKYDLLEILMNANFLVLAESLSDPGNVGTLIRTADGMGADGILLTSGSAEAWNPKVLRAAAGSIFHLPVVEGLALSQCMQVLREKGVQIGGAHLKSDNMLYNVDFRKPSCLLIGNEAHGLSDEAVALCDFLFKIPMPGMAESLNASVAGGIMMYEVSKQKLMERRCYGGGNP